MLYIATLDTRHWSFMSSGETEQEAREALEAGWAKHAKQCGPHLVDGFGEYADSVRVDQISAGQCLRDGIPITEG
jgi:hypothetical protein